MVSGRAQPIGKPRALPLGKPILCPSWDGVSLPTSCPAMLVITGFSRTTLAEFSLDLADGRVAIEVTGRAMPIGKPWALPLGKPVLCPGRSEGSIPFS